MQRAWLVNFDDDMENGGDDNRRLWQQQWLWQRGQRGVEKNKGNISFSSSSFRSSSSPSNYCSSSLFCCCGGERGGEMSMAACGGYRVLRLILPSGVPGRAVLGAVLLLLEGEGDLLPFPWRWRIRRRWWYVVAEVSVLAFRKGCDRVHAPFFFSVLVFLQRILLLILTPLFLGHGEGEEWNDTFYLCCLLASYFWPKTHSNDGDGV